MPKGIPKNGARAEKASAKTLTLNGETLSVRVWSEKIGVAVSAINARIKKGWPIAEVLSARKWAGPGYVEGKSYRFSNQQKKGAHVVAAETALGKPLPAGAVVHHADGDKRNNANSNLVICQDRAYHMMLHMRQRALDESGDANNRRCTYCKQWDRPENLYINRTARHVECHRAYQANRRAG